jgi:surfeit locus 1 family protein
MRIIGWVLVVAGAALFIRLGIWQLDRLDERVASNRLIEQNLGAPPEPLATVLAEPGDLAYRHAVAVGEYAPAYEVLLRNRSLNDENGFHVLTPLVLSSGGTLLVDRGWVSLEFDQPPVMTPPLGTVEVTGVLRPSATASRFGPKDPAAGRLDVVFWPDLERLSSQMPGTLEPMYLELRSQTPEAATTQPIPADDPVLDNGPHLSYAIQWFSFALIAVVGYVLLLRRRSGARRESEGAGRPPG